MIDVAAPGAASPPRSKKWLQTEDGTPFYVNIMGDPRVYRGPVHGRQNAPISSPGAPPSASIAKRKHSRRFKLPSLDELHKSVYVERAFEPVPIHLYLEEQNLQPVLCLDQILQTDEFLPTAPELPYIPAKIGLDVGTQVDPDSGDLFSFDEAIDPTVRVMVSKTLEQALIEVRMETDLDYIAERKLAAENAQLERDRAMAELERRAAEQRAETEQITKAERKRVQKEAAAIQKVKSQKIAIEYLCSLQTAVCESLFHRGFLYDRAEADVADIVLPWLAESISHRLTLRSALNRHIVDNLIRNAVDVSTKNWQHENDVAERKREERRALERLRALVIKLHLRLPEMEGRLLGPVSVRNGQTIGEAQTAVRTWLKKNAPDLAEESAEWPMQLRLDEVLLPNDLIIMDIGLSNLSTLDLSFVKDLA